MDQKWNPIMPPLRGRMLVVGGQCSKVGKTALVVDLLSALRDQPNGQGWTVVKITPHVESGCPVNGPNCSCGPDEHVVDIREEKGSAFATDTGRFIAAGAERALWVRTKPGHLRQALPALAHSLASADHIIMESNAIVEFWRPAACFLVLDASNPDFKLSARQAMSFADAFVLRSPLPAPDDAEWRRPAILTKPTFLQLLGQPLPAGVQELAKQLLRLPEHLSTRHQPNHW